LTGTGGSDGAVVALLEGVGITFSSWGGDDDGDGEEAAEWEGEDVASGGDGGEIAELEGLVSFPSCWDGGGGVGEVVALEVAATPKMVKERRLSLKNSNSPYQQMIRGTTTTATNATTLRACVRLPVGATCARSI
jgi:hypothetical protein